MTYPGINLSTLAWRSLDPAQQNPTHRMVEDKQ